MRDEYRIREVTAPTLEAWTGKLDGVDPDGFLREVAEYNAAVDTDTPFNPNVKDGRAAQGLLAPA